MKHRQIVETRLAQLGVPMSEDEVRQLGDAYAILVEWQSVVNTMLEKRVEPAEPLHGEMDG